MLGGRGAIVVRLPAAPLLLVLLLLAPSAAARPICTQYGCANAEDRDGDGDIDWATLATSIDHQLTLNALYNESTLYLQGDAGTEEIGEEYHFVAFQMWADENGGADEAWLFVEAREGDEESGSTQLGWAYLVLDDADGDGVPAPALTHDLLP